MLILIILMYSCILCLAAWEKDSMNRDLAVRKRHGGLQLLEFHLLVVKTEFHLTFYSKSYLHPPLDNLFLVTIS